MGTIIQRLLLLGGIILFADTVSASPSNWPTDPSVNVPLCTAVDNQSFEPWVCWPDQVVSDGWGGAIVVWEDNRSGTETNIFAQRIDGQGNVRWGANGVSVCTATGDQLSPRLEMDGAHGAYIVWMDKRNAAADVYAQRVDVDGNSLWTSDGILIGAAVLEEDLVDVVMDGAGGAIFVWENDDFGHWIKRTDSNGNFLWTHFLSFVFDEVSQFRALADGAGGVIVVWRELPSSISDTDIYAGRVDASGNETWTDKPVCTEDSNQLRPQIVSDGAGGAIILWIDERTGPPVYAQRLDPNGNPLWTTDGVPITTTLASIHWPIMIADGAGGAIVAFWSTPDARFIRQIRAQRLDSNGNFPWAPDGIEVTTGGTSELYAQLVSDGNGGAIVTWQDSRNLSLDLYAQRVDSNGNTLWPANGVAVCSADSNQQDPQIVSNGAGGAIVVWEDERNMTGFDIYAQQVDSDGSIGVATGIGDNVPRLPDRLQLLQNVPNPFSIGTEIRYHLPTTSAATVEVFDVTGERVFQRRLPGHPNHWQSFFFDGRTNDGQQLATGVYFYRVSAGSATRTRKMVILK